MDFLSDVLFCWYSVFAACQLPVQTDEKVHWKSLNCRRAKQEHSDPFLNVNTNDRFRLESCLLPPRLLSEIDAEGGGRDMALHETQYVNFGEAPGIELNSLAYEDYGSGA